MSTQMGSVASALAAFASLRKLPKGTAAAGLLGLLAATFSLHIAYRWYRLSHIKGPFWASFSSLWMVRVVLGGSSPTIFKGVTDKYGKIQASCSLDYRQPLIGLGSLARVGPNELITDDPDVLRRMMAVRSPYTRGPCKLSFDEIPNSSTTRLMVLVGHGVQRLDPARDNLVSMRDEVAHRELRAKMAAGVSPHIRWIYDWTKNNRAF